MENVIIMTNVLILGGGFAGVRSALTLKKEIKKLGLKITVIDRNSFHTFTPALYEVATSEEPQKNVVIPYKDILGNSIKFEKGTVLQIDVGRKRILLDGKKEYAYDYLILALGSNSADFGIPGIKEYGIPLKTLEDAVKIKNSLKNAKKVIVGGGGFAGTEIACELATHKGHLDVSLIQRSQIILKELGDGISDLAKRRLKRSNVHLVLGERIKNVTKEFVELEGGNKLSYDVFIWTGGVRSNNLLGKIEVNDSLQVNNFTNIFAAGDVVSPGVAPRAEKMGETAAKNVLNFITRKSQIKYSYHELGYLVPLGGHFATFATGRFHISGFLASILQQLILFRYLLQILPFLKAIKRFLKFEKDLDINWIG